MKDKILDQCEPPPLSHSQDSVDLMIDRTRSRYCGRLGFMLENGDSDRYINSISGAATFRQNIVIKA